jgi:hypothetical protein
MKGEKTMKKSLLFATLVLALVLCFSGSAFAGETPSPFTDVNGDDWYVDMVNGFAEAGYVQGYDDQTFCPDNCITRAEFAVMACNFFGYLSPAQQSPERTVTFSDVNEGDWYYTQVMTLADRGIINGYPNGTFAPNQYITREEIAYILYKFFGPIGLNSAPADAYIFFPDVLADRWSANAINTLAYFQFVKGYPDGTFRPANNATRAEAVCFLAHFMG